MMWPLVVYFAFAVVLVTAVIGLSYLLGPRHLEPATGEPYEGGISRCSKPSRRLWTTYSANVKRVLADSSIAHFGYILVAFLAGPTMSAGAVSFYPVAYTVTLLATFGIVSVLSAEKGDAGNLEEYRGAFVLGGLAVLLLWFGVYPESLLNLIRTAMGGPGYAG